QASSFEFFQLGFDPVLEISAEHGQGVAELLDEIVKRIPQPQAHAESREHTESQTPNPESREEVAVAIVGRPNVGKSSLLNRLLNEERVLVSDMPGTTRDAIDAVVTWHRRRFRIVDTAGIRRPGRVARGGKVELVSVAAAKRSIADADVVAL